jgi:phage repressor protein C with HTH and peptisase S24 domain
MELKEKLKKIRGSMTFIEFSKLTGISDAALVRYEHGRIPKVEQLQKIAQAVNLPISYLLDEVQKKSDKIEVKIVGMIPAGHTDIYEQPEVMDPIIMPFKHMKNCVAVQVMGESMERMFFDGDILIIKERPDQLPRKDGLTYVIEWEECDKIMRAVKNVYKEEKGFRLVSENKKFKDIMTDNIRKLYKIVGVIMPEFRSQTSQ